MSATLASVFISAAAIATTIQASETIASGYPFGFTEGYKSAEDQATDWAKEAVTYFNHRLDATQAYDPSTVTRLNFDANTLTGKFTVSRRNHTANKNYYVACNEPPVFKFLPGNKPLVCHVTGPAP